LHTNEVKNGKGPTWGTRGDKKASEKTLNTRAPTFWGKSLGKTAGIKSSRKSTKTKEKKKTTAHFSEKKRKRSLRKGVQSKNEKSEDRHPDAKGSPESSSEENFWQGKKKKSSMEGWQKNVQGKKRNTVVGLPENVREET